MRLILITVLLLMAITANAGEKPFRCSPMVQCDGHGVWELMPHQDSFFKSVDKTATGFVQGDYPLRLVFVVKGDDKYNGHATCVYNHGTGYQITFETPKSLNVTADIKHSIPGEWNYPANECDPKVHDCQLLLNLK